MNKKVLFVVGSLREKSFNRTVAESISIENDIYYPLQYISNNLIIPNCSWFFLLYHWIFFSNFKFNMFIYISTNFYLLC